MIRWLLVGAGAVGRVHRVAIERTASAALAGIVDPDPAARGSQAAYASLDEALARANADAAVIATPTDTHVALATRCLHAGLAVLVEKPAGRSSAEARAILEASARYGRPAGIVLNQRACRHNLWIRDLIGSGALRVRSITIRGVLPALHGWVNDTGRSGGALLRTVGIHYLDLLYWWVGAPLAVSAQLDPPHADRVVALVAEYPGDVRADLRLTAMGGPGMGPVEIVIQGDGARIELRGHHVIAFDGVPPPPDGEPVDPALPYGPGHLGVIREATAALEAGRELPVPIEVVLETLAVIDRAYAEADQGA